MRAHTTTTKVALLSLLALGGLGLVACGGGDDDGTTAASATEITDSRTTYDELAADPADNKSCGVADRRGLTVVEGDISCREVRRLMHRVAYNRLPYQWRCIGPEGATGGYEVCTNLPGASSRIVISVRFPGEAVTAADPENKNRLSDEEEITKVGNEWAQLFAKPGSVPCRYMSQPVCERIACERVGDVPIKSCTPPSAAFRRSFEDATVEDIAIKGRNAGVKFSNGEAVELVQVEEHPHCIGSGCPGEGRVRTVWWVSKFGANAGREFFE
jgi:hypothetical protein